MPILSLLSVEISLFVASTSLSRFANTIMLLLPLKMVGDLILFKDVISATSL